MFCCNMLMIFAASIYKYGIGALCKYESSGGLVGKHGSRFTWATLDFG
jgi:hypothetical protein